MRVITIQDIGVYKTLLKYGRYTVSELAPVPVNLIKPYEFMKKHYKYYHRPIFLCPVGYHVNFGGAKTEHAHIIEFEIPDRFCKVQDYYGWSDFIYFTELPWEYQPFNGNKTVEQFGRYVLDMYKDGPKQNDCVYQVTTQFLLKSWIKDIKNVDRNFINKYYDTGGDKVLESIIGTHR